jgi:hypothetical protein
VTLIAKAFKAKKSADRSVELGREYVEVYINYIHYVEGIHTAVMSNDGHHGEGAGAGKSEHGE